MNIGLAINAILGSTLDIRMGNFMERKSLRQLKEPYYITLITFNTR